MKVITMKIPREQYNHLTALDIWYLQLQAEYKIYGRIRPRKPDDLKFTPITRRQPR